MLKSGISSHFRYEMSISDLKLKVLGKYHLDLRSLKSAQMWQNVTHPLRNVDFRPKIDLKSKVYFLGKTLDITPSTLGSYEVKINQSQNPTYN